MVEPRLWLIVESPGESKVSRLVNSIERVDPYGVIINDATGVSRAMQGVSGIAGSFSRERVLGVSCLGSPVAEEVERSRQAGFSTCFVRRQLAPSGRPRPALMDIQASSKKCGAPDVMVMAGSVQSTTCDNVTLGISVLSGMGMSAVIDMTSAYEAGRLPASLRIPDIHVGEVFVVARMHVEPGDSRVSTQVTDLLVSECNW